MKTGKNISLKLFSDLKTTYGTVDSTKFKSLFVNIQTWVEPKAESEKWKSTIGLFSRKIKHIIRAELNNSIFKNTFILDLDLRSSGILLNKKSFMNIEITLYPEIQKEFKSSDIRDFVSHIIKKIYSEAFKDNNNFSFHRTKKPNAVKTPLSI